MKFADLVEVAGATVALMLGLCALIGLAVRFVALPWLRDHIALPLAETRRQVTVNGHVSDTPTLLDRVDTATQQLGGVRAQLDDVEGKVDDATSRVNTTAKMLDGHLDRSAGEWGRLWDAIDDLRAHVGLPRLRHDTTNTRERAHP